MPPKKNKIVEKIEKEIVTVDSDNVDIPETKKTNKQIILKTKSSIPEPIINESIEIEKPKIKKQVKIPKETSKEINIKIENDEIKDEEKYGEEKDGEDKDGEDKDGKKEKLVEQHIKKPYEEKKKEESTKSKDTNQISNTKTNTILKQTTSSFDMFGDDNVDYRFIMSNYDCKKNKTLPKITKYERALLVGKRAKQIEEGANANIKVMPGQSSIEIAEEELRQRKIPFFLKRPIGNKFEYWKPADMEVLMD